MRSFLFVILSATALVGSNSRTSIIAVGITLAIFHVIKIDIVRLLKFSIVSIIAVLSMSHFFPSVFDRIGSAANIDTFPAIINNIAFTINIDSPVEYNINPSQDPITISGDRNLSIRGFLWGRAIKEGIMSPFIGIGFGRYNDLGREFRSINRFVNVAVSASYYDASIRTAHNTLLHHWAELGLVGLIGIGLIFIPLFKCFWISVSKSNRKSINRFWAEVGISSTICLFITGLAQHTIGAPIYSLTYGIVCVTAYRFAKKPC